jgi:hypothetical protein
MRESKGRRPLGTPRLRFVDDIKTDPWEKEWNGMMD